jgi:effector-binding domain-containing protein
MELIQEPQVVHRPEMPYLGIRVVTPFRGMLSTRDRLMRELSKWVDQNDTVGAGRFFLRLHVIDMNGPMDLEVGVTTTERLAGDASVRPGILPEGHYATLTYRNHALRANRALLEWAAAHAVELDRTNEPAGDRFGCRYESYVTDPRTEPRKTKWVVELNIRLRHPPTGDAGTTAGTRGLR